MDDKKIISETRRIVDAVHDCIKANQPKEELDAGEAAVILLAIMSDLAANTILNLATTYSLINKKSIEDEIKKFEEAFFKSVSASIASTDLTNAQISVALNMVKTVREMKQRTKLEAELKMNDNIPKKAGPWGYPIITETEQ